MNFIGLPVELLDDVGAIAFFFIIAKMARWKLNEWQAKSYWFFISLCLLTLMAELLYKVVIYD